MLCRTSIRPCSAGKIPKIAAFTGHMGIVTPADEPLYPQRNWHFPFQQPRRPGRRQELNYAISQDDRTPSSSAHCPVSWVANINYMEFSPAISLSQSCLNLKRSSYLPGSRGQGRSGLGLGSGLERCSGSARVMVACMAIGWLVCFGGGRGRLAVESDDKTQSSQNLLEQGACRLLDRKL